MYRVCQITCREHLLGDGRCLFVTSDAVNLNTCLEMRLKGAHRQTTRSDEQHPLWRAAGNQREFAANQACKSVIQKVIGESDFCTQQAINKYAFQCVLPYATGKVNTCNF